MNGEMIQALSDPNAYEHAVDDITVIQTHISVVFLVGEFVYKIKKPVDLGFLDFTTLEGRRHFCEEEVRLNRRLAPDVYLGVFPIVDVDGQVRVALDPLSAGVPPLEWAVRMRRLPDDRTMASWVDDDTLRPYHVAVLGRRVATFHRDAERGPEVSAWGEFSAVAGNARENLTQAIPHIDRTLTAELHARISGALERELERLEPLISKRASRDVPCDTHGDLHLDHIYLFADHDPPNDIVIIDCIEFNERFRFADPVADMAFVDMDLRYQGRADLAAVFADAYFDAAEDVDGRALLAFYSAYRAAVRAKVAGFRALQEEVPGQERDQAIQSGRAHWLLALRTLEPPRLRPCLILIGGLPGTGKSTLATALGKEAALDVISSDRTRKSLAGVAPETSAAAEFGEGIYTPEWNDRTYAALLEDAEERLLRGERVIVDASFREDGRRSEFLSLASRLRVPGLFLLLEAPAQRVLDRIATRDPGASDADRQTYEDVARRWEDASDLTRPLTRNVDTSQTGAWSVEQALEHLAALGA